MPDNQKAANGAEAGNAFIPSSSRDWNETDPARVEVPDDNKNKSSGREGKSSSKSAREKRSFDEEGGQRLT